MDTLGGAMPANGSTLAAASLAVAAALVEVLDVALPRRPRGG